MADETVSATTDAAVPAVLAEHYPPSAALKHTLLDRRDALELWRTVARREGMQQRDRVDFQVLEDGAWVASHSRENGARLILETLAARSI